MASTVASRASGSSGCAALLALLLAGPVAAAPAPAEPVVPVDTLELEMDKLDAEVLFKKDKNDTSTFPVKVVMADGTRLSGRIGTKGGFTQGFAKKPLLIKLDKGNKWFGQSRISLNAMSVDRSLTREWLAWDLIHALGMAAPVTRYTFVRINDRDQGLFFRIEWIGPDLFDRFGYGKDADMYDPVDKISCADLSRDSVARPEKCWVQILPSGGGYVSLKRLVDELDREPVESFPQYLDREFDVESAINFIVVTIVTANTTTYNDEYFLIRSHARNRWFIIPWAYDRSFGWAYEPAWQEPEASDNDHFQYYYPLELGAANPLRDKVFMNPALQQRVKRRITELIYGSPDAAHPWQGWLEPERLRRHIADVHDAIGPYIARDRFVDPANVAEKRHALEYYTDMRARFLSRLIGGAGAAPDTASAPLPGPGQSAHAIDAAGYLMARLTGRTRSAPAAFTASILRGRPELVPPGAERDACVQRTWFLEAGAPAQAFVTLEYFEESVALSELGPRVADERSLDLYLRDARGWWRLQTQRDRLSNTLGAALALPARERLRLVACEPPPQTAGP
jgi:hypothetical protein